MRVAKIIEIGGGAAALLQAIQMLGTDTEKVLSVNVPLFAVCLVVAWIAHTRRWRDRRSLMGIAMMLVGALVFATGATMYYKKEAEVATAPVTTEPVQAEVAQPVQSKPHGQDQAPPQTPSPIHIESHDQTGGVNTNYGTVNQYGQPQAPTRKDYSAEIARLSEFINEGDLVRDDFMKSKDTPAIQAARSAWVRRVVEYLRDIEAGSYVSDFTTTRASAWEGLPAGYNVDGGAAYMDIGAKQRALTKIKDDLRGRT
jgi:hypothetical protein